MSDIRHEDLQDLVTKQLSEENSRLREALEFYAKGNHFEYDGPHCDEDEEPESVSGEPTNFQCGHGSFTYEDGFIARQALGKSEKF